MTDALDEPAQQSRRCGQPRQPAQDASSVRGHPFACPARSRVSDGELQQRQPPASCGRHRVLLRASFRQPTISSTSTWFPGCQPILSSLGPHHARAELVENPKCRFVALQSQAAAGTGFLFYGRYAGGLTGNQIGSPEPCAQRYVAAFHDRPGPSIPFGGGIYGRARTPGRVAMRNSSPGLP